MASALARGKAARRPPSRRQAERITGNERHRGRDGEHSQRRNAMTITQDELDVRFTLRNMMPTENVPDKYVTLSDAARSFAELIVALTPESREQSLAITHVEEASMWANAAIARREL